MVAAASGLTEQAQDFGQEMAGVLLATMPGLPDPLPLFARGQRIAGFKVSVSCQLDSAGVYLAIYESTDDLLAEVDRGPLLRFHYRRYQQSEPSAHIHVHGHRGALSHLLSRRWRLRQAGTVTRDAPEEAARVLRELGYKVTPPDPVPTPVAQGNAELVGNPAAWRCR